MYMYIIITANKLLPFLSYMFVQPLRFPLVEIFRLHEQRMFKRFSNKKYQIKFLERFIFIYRLLFMQPKAIRRTATNWKSIYIELAAIILHFTVCTSVHLSVSPSVVWLRNTHLPFAYVVAVCGWFCFAAVG